MCEGLLLGLSWLDGSVSIVLSWRKVVLVLQFSAVCHHVEVNVFIL
jgi:hypothetical protein